MKHLITWFLNAVMQEEGRSAGWSHEILSARIANYENELILEVSSPS